jgi:hypothetical protein
MRPRKAATGLAIKASMPPHFQSKPPLRREVNNMGQRKAITWAGAVVLLGLGMLVLAYRTEEYWQSLWLQVGSTVILVGPLVWLEESFRDLTRQVEETKDDLRRTTADMHAIREALATAEQRRAASVDSLTAEAGEGGQGAFLELLRRDEGAAVDGAGPRARLVGTRKPEKHWLEGGSHQVEHDLRLRFSVAENEADVLLVHVEDQSGRPYYYRRLSPPGEAASAASRKRSLIKLDPIRWLPGQGPVELKEALANAIAPEDAPDGGWTDSVTTALGLMTSLLRVAADLRAGEAAVTLRDVGRVIEMLDDHWLITRRAVVCLGRKPPWIRTTMMPGVKILDSRPTGDAPDGAASAEQRAMTIW